MKPHRVTIKYMNGEQTHTLSTVIPAYTERQAIESVISANSLGGKVVRRKAELLKTN